LSISVTAFNGFPEVYIYTSHRHHDCIFTDGQARKEEPSDNKLFWNGIAFIYLKIMLLVFLSVQMHCKFTSSSFLMKAASMLLLSLSFTWKALAPYSGTLAVVGTVL
jgi:hypothetical protein